MPLNPKHCSLKSFYLTFFSHETLILGVLKGLSVVFGVDPSCELPSMFTLQIRNTDLPHCVPSLALPSCGILRMKLQGRQTEVTTKYSSTVHSPDDTVFFTSETTRLQQELSKTTNVCFKNMHSLVLIILFNSGQKLYKDNSTCSECLLDGAVGGWTLPSWILYAWMTKWRFQCAVGMWSIESVCLLNCD